LENEDDESKHYFVLTKTILENASLPDMLVELKQFEELLKINNKGFYKSLIKMFKDCKIVSNLH
jgi:hypothetical protein